MISINLHKKLKTYGGQQVLSVDKQWQAGTVVKIHGPSGAGKTTFLKLIAGLIKPDSGVISFNNNVWFNSDADINLSTQRRQTGFVFQDYALFPNMTVLQHLQYATNDEAWINKLLSIGKLDAFTAHKPIHLSGGQQQRLAILRALATKPQLLLMDEPFSALDKTTKTQLIAELKVLFAQLKLTVFIVSHNMAELDDIAGEEFYIGDAE